MGGGTSKTSSDSLMPPYPALTPKEKEEFETDEAHLTDEFKEHLKELNAFYDSLDTREKNVLKQFIGQYIEAINDSLGKVPINKLYENEARVVRILDSLFKSVPTVKTSFNTFRGIKGIKGLGLPTSAKTELIKALDSGDSATVSQFVKQYLTGGTVSSKGYSMTSTSRKNIEQKISNRGIVMRVRVPKGASGIPVTKQIFNSKTQKTQYLLNRGSQFTVRDGAVGKTSKGNYLILDVDLK